MLQGLNKRSGRIDERENQDVLEMERLAQKRLGLDAQAHIEGDECSEQKLGKQCKKKRNTAQATPDDRVSMDTDECNASTEVRVSRRV